MTQTTTNKSKDFWEATAKRFARSGFKAVCTPTSLGLVNSCSDILQKIALKPFLHRFKGAKILDVGCGVGRWSLRLLESDADVVGVDIAEHMVREAHRRQLAKDSERKAKFVVGTVVDLPFKDSVFDCALSVTVLQHIIDEQEVRRAALEMIRVVRPGGKIIILEISSQRRRRIALDFPTAFRSTAEWIALFTEGQDTKLERLDGVALSIFVKPLNWMILKFTSGTEYARQLVGNASVKFTIIKGLYYLLLNIAILLSLPLDLVLRGKLLNQSTHKLFIFKKLNKNAQGSEEGLLVRKTLRDVTFVIPTNRDNVRTLDSIPEGCDVKLEREGNENEARNRGIRNARTEYIALCDDDIHFTHNFLDRCLALAKEGVIVGLEDYYPLRWLISRFMLFAKSDWQKIGDFDESVRHGAETEFCIRAEKLGFKIVRLPRSSVRHFEHEKPAYHQTHVKWLWYLWRRHPRQMTVPALKLIFRKITGIQL